MDKVELINGKLQVPDRPVIPFIEGDGIGRDITEPSQKVINAAVEKAYGSNRRKLIWKEVLAGEKAFRETGNYLPRETIDISAISCRN
jgi:isocitrate dehydrogenase